MKDASNTEQVVRVTCVCTREQEVLGHKQHAPEPELPVDKTPVRRSSRASKLLKERGGGKIEHLYQSHSADRGKMRPSIRGESASSSNSGSMSDGEKEGIEERGRRRNRDSLSGRRLGGHIASSKSHTIELSLYGSPLSHPCC